MSREPLTDKQAKRVFNALINVVIVTLFLGFISGIFIGIIYQATKYS